MNTEHPNRYMNRRQAIALSNGTVSSMTAVVERLERVGLGGMTAKDIVVLTENQTGMYELLSRVGTAITAHRVLRDGLEWADGPDASSDEAAANLWSLFVTGEIQPNNQPA